MPPVVAVSASGVPDAPVLRRAAHPREVLLGAQAATATLPACDHYCGVEDRMRKSLQLQAQLQQEYGACVFDVTLDCEDGAAVGAEAAHVRLVARLVHGTRADQRVAVRVHAVDHPAFSDDMAVVAGDLAPRLCHVMLPKVERPQDVDQACEWLDRYGASSLPVHALIESPAAVHQAYAVAAHPRVQSLSFGLMDFVSAHGGAIPASAMGAVGQFQHPLVVRAKLEIAAACHAHGKVPSHCVVTEFRNGEALAVAARKASQELGYTRMWSIHPMQVRPIIEAFAPTSDEIQGAAEVVLAAAQAEWAPISVGGTLHDRASYRYFWQVLERAHQTGRALPTAVQGWFATEPVAVP